MGAHETRPLDVNPICKRRISTKRLPHRTMVQVIKTRDYGQTRFGGLRKTLGAGRGGNRQAIRSHLRNYKG